MLTWGQVIKISWNMDKLPGIEFIIPDTEGRSNGHVFQTNLTLPKYKWNADRLSIEQALLNCKLFHAIIISWLGPRRTLYSKFIF